MVHTFEARRYTGKNSENFTSETKRVNLWMDAIPLVQQNSLMISSEVAVALITNPQTSSF